MNNAHGVAGPTNQRAGSGEVRRQSSARRFVRRQSECGRSDYHFAIAVVISACDFEASL
jgi:hypothetical protein